MKKIIWEVQLLSVPPVLKYCKKCGGKSPFICSGQFRVNAQRKYLDIWLIYKCANCDTTWNATLYSRISPQALAPDLLESFYKNDQMMAEQYAMNFDLLRRNGVEVGLPVYSIIGDEFSSNEPVTLEIKSKYAVQIKVASIIREKLHLSQKDYFQLVADRKIMSIPEKDLRKCKLKNGITLVFQADQ